MVKWICLIFKTKNWCNSPGLKKYLLIYFSSSFWFSYITAYWICCWLQLCLRCTAAVT